MIKNQVLTFFLVLSSCIANCGIYPHFALIDLVYQADDVMEAKLIYYEKDSAVYEAVSLFNPSRISTLVFEDFSMDFEIFSKPENEYDDEALEQYFHLVLDRHYGIPIENSKTIIVFLYKDANGKVQRSLTGAFFHHLGDIYFPQADEIPGDYSIRALDTVLTWDQFKGNIRSIHQRVESFKAMLRIEPSSETNAMWIDWLKVQEENRPMARCPLTADCGWGNLLWLGYNQILISGDWEKAWYASELFDKNYGFFLTDTSGSYSNAGARKYFEELSFTPEMPSEKRLAALRFFEQSMWYPYALKDKMQVPEKIMGDIKATIAKLKILLPDYELQRTITSQLESLLYNKHDEIKAMAREEVVPIFMQEYKLHRIGWNQNDIQNLIFDWSSIDQLIEVSGHPDGVLADITNLFMDTMMSRVSLDISIKVHNKSVERNAVIYFQHRAESYPLISYPIELQGESYNPGEKRYSYTKSYKNLSPGEWKVYVTGTLTGDDEPVPWKTNVVTFYLEE